MTNGNDLLLMTGATGFLGHYVLRDLLALGQSVVAMLRPPLRDSRARLLAMLGEIGADPGPWIAGGQLRFVEGSLPDGLPEPSWGATSAVLHCAASLQLFSNGNGNPFKTNVAGAAAILDWADGHGVETIHSVSTAYTCGWNRGVIKETFHEPQPKFQTDYEKSKWVAEHMLGQWAQAEQSRRVTIYRPSILVGDSQTGYTTQFGGFYQVSRLFKMLKEHYQDKHNGPLTRIPLRIPGMPDTQHNVVPVDFVARIMAEVVTCSEFHGRIYHLTNPKPPTNETFKRCYETYFGMEGGSFADPSEVVGQCSPAESMIYDRYQLLTPRLDHNPQFDITHTRAVMAEMGITFPELTQKRLTRLLDFAAQADWGRGRNGFHG